jgi:uncharacterized membrane protein YeaQ/YmgE (transglycosylase-associated protein family)
MLQATHPSSQKRLAVLALPALLSPLHIPRRMCILSDHRESKGSSPWSSRFSLGLALSLSLLEATLTRYPISVHSKGLTTTLNPLDATLTKNTGGGPAICHQLLSLPVTSPSGIPQTVQKWAVRTLDSLYAPRPVLQTGSPGFIANAGLILDDCSEGKGWRKSMFHLIWYLLIGLIAGVIAKDVMHVHITLFWTVALGVIGGILGGGVTHMFARPTNEKYHPAGLIFSTLGAILVLYLCFRLNIHFPAIST